MGLLAFGTEDGKIISDGVIMTHHYVIKRHFFFFSFFLFPSVLPTYHDVIMMTHDDVIGRVGLYEVFSQRYTALPAAHRNATVYELSWR